MADHVMKLREGYIEEIVALEAQIADDCKAEIARERGRADAAEKRAARSEAQRDQLLGEIDKHRASSSPTSTPQEFSLDGELYAAADKVRKERGDA